jgi:hypothetical protein
MIGEKFGKLTIISKLDGFRTWKHENYGKVIAKCDCGRVKAFNFHHVKRGKSQSCGCTKGKSNATHNLTRHPLYNVWENIKKRCFHPNNPSYKYYGGRGIMMCDAWCKDFQVFYDWCMANGWEKGLQIDRKDNDGNYEPSNCRCVTHLANNRNKGNNVYVEMGNVRKSLAEWVEGTGVKYATVYSRLRKGIELSKALSTGIVFK